MTPQNNSTKPMKTAEEWLCRWPSHKASNAECLNFIRAIQQDALDAQNEKYQALVAFYDKRVGTPCEQIRHQQELENYEEVLTDHKRLVREIDIIINGEEGAAKQASLCDLVGQIKALASRGDDPRLLPELPDGWHLRTLKCSHLVDIHGDIVDYFYDAWITKYEAERTETRLNGEGPTPRAAVLAALEKIG